MDNKSYYHVMEYESSDFSFSETFSTDIPWISTTFLEGSVLFKDHIYILTYLEYRVFVLDPTTLQVFQVMQWDK